MSVASIQRFFRTRRMREFARVLGVRGGTRILDVGGTPEIWGLLDVVPDVVLLNTPRAMEKTGGRFRYVEGDGCRLPFADGSFDIVFSNSVIEHVGDGAAQAAFAGEMARVGRAYWVQTPNRYFPVEVHLLTPFVHWLPKGWQRAIVRRFTVWEWMRRPVADEREFYLEHFLRDVRLLSARDLGGFFPGAVVRRERFLGWTKSLVAFRLGP